MTGFYMKYNTRMKWVTVRKGHVYFLKKSTETN